MVASTDVYGSIAGAIGGSKVNVTSIIKGPSQDPHSYQATAQDKLTVSKAQLGIENGGGYDDFFDQLAGGGTLSADRIVNVVDLSGLQTPANKADFNEHVWYSLPTMAKLADALAERLTALDPAGRRHVQGQRSSVQDLHYGDRRQAGRREGGILRRSGGHHRTCPAVHAAGRRPGEQDAGGIQPRHRGRLRRSGRGAEADHGPGRRQGCRFLAYNSQTEGPQTETVRKAAEAAGVPVVNFTETLPDGLDYLAG